MAPVRPVLCLAAFVISAALVGACGDDKAGSELRSRDAGSLRATLSSLEQRVDIKDCTGASRQAAAFRAQIDGLSGSVSSKLRRALVASANRLETLVADQCASEPPAPADTTPPAGTTSQDSTQGNEENQTGNGKKDKKPKKEKPKQDETQTQTQPDTGGAGDEVPGVGNQGDGASPEG